MPMAGFDEDLVGKQDPDDAALAQNHAEWGEVIAEDPLEILEDPTVALELSEDPVRLYLKEIGQIHLLDADSEFRLAARIEAPSRQTIADEKTAADNTHQVEAAVAIDIRQHHPISAFHVNRWLQGKLAGTVIEQDGMKSSLAGAVNHQEV